MKPKTEQLQIRVSPEEKSALRRLARMHDMDLSAFVLSRMLPRARTKLLAIVQRLNDDATRSYGLAELNDFLISLTPGELSLAVQDSIPLTRLPADVANYVAALIELAAVRNRRDVPEWLNEIAPLEQPYFASSLLSLRLHLLVSSPPPFRRRNLFVDATLGDRV